MNKKNNTFNNIEKNTFTILIITIFLSVFLYVYFISTSVVSVVQRKSIEIETQVLSSSVGELESEYISLSKNITLSYARSLGFIEPEDVSFAYTRLFAVNLGSGI